MGSWMNVVMILLQPVGSDYMICKIEQWGGIFLPGGP